MMTARELVRGWLGIERIPDGLPGIRDPEAPCQGFDPGRPAGTWCETDGHYLCRECTEAPEKDPLDETPSVSYDAARRWVNL